MRHKWRGLVLVGLMVGLVTGLGSVSAGAAPGAAVSAVATSVPYCGITWGSLPKTASGTGTAPLVDVRTGQHDCWDRVVFEADGVVDGYTVEYGEVYTEGQGLALSPYTAGGALLGVHLRMPVTTPDGTVTYPVEPSRHVANVLGYQTLRDVVFGGSFEGHTTFAVGVRAKLPFRVFILAGPGTHSRVVLDVAHFWEQ
jgi:hypothetical protein